MGSTPKNLQRINTFTRNVRHLDPEVSYSSFREGVEKLARASQIQAELVEQLQEDLYSAEAAQEARKARSRASRSYLQKGGVISKHEVARMTRIEKDSDDLVAKNKLRAKWRKVMTELKAVCLARGIIVRRTRRS